MAALTPVSAYTQMQVYDLDFSAANPIAIHHSYQTSLLDVRMINTSDPTANVLTPSVVFTDTNTITVTGNTHAGNALGQFRIFISVVPTL